MDVRAPLRSIDRFQRTRSWAAVPVATVQRFGDHGSGGLASSIAYYGFFSLFPLLMVLTSIGSIVLAHDQELQGRLLDSALSQFPVVGTQISRNVGSIEGSALAVIVGTALALWAGIGGVRSAQVAMDTVWDVPRRERSAAPVAIARAALMLVVLGSFLLAGAIVSGIAGGMNGVWGPVVVLVASGLLNIAVFMLAYRVLTIADVSWRAVIPGSLFAGLGWTGLVAAGGWIVSDRLRSSSDVYGTFAIVIGLLTWIYLGAQVTLLGAELNAVVARRLWPRSLIGDVLTSADVEALERSARQEERKEHEIVDVRFDDEDEAAEPTAGRGAADGTRSIGSLVASVIDGLKELVRHEVELAKIEAGEAISVKARGAGLVAGAGVAALFALGFIAVAGAVGLALVLPLWLSLLIVAGVFVLAGAVLFTLGRRELKAPAGIDRTQESVREDVRWAKQQIGR